MGNTCGCGDKGDLEQEVRADPVSRNSKNERDDWLGALFTKIDFVCLIFNHFHYCFAEKIG